MELLVKAPVEPRKVGILSGSFHPITRAHVALAEAALDRVDEVVFVMPRAFPHKQYEGVALEQRIDLVRRAAGNHGRFSVGVTEGGLFIDIARESKLVYDTAELWFLCGRDTAERIVGWNYSHTPIERQLEEYGLLVAERQGSYTPPEHLAHRILPLPLKEDWNEVSATEIRRRIQADEDWRHLVPEAIAGRVELLYR